MTQPGLPTGVIDLFTHPPLVTLRPVIDNFGPYSPGSHELRNFGWDMPPITPRLVSQTFGIQVQLAGAIPPQWSYTQGWVSNDGQYEESVYYPPLGYVVAQHQFPNGAWITTTRLTVDRFPIATMWELAYPGRVGLYVSPRVELDLFYYIEGV